MVGKTLRGTNLALGVVRQHDLDLEANNTLAQQHVPDGRVNVGARGEARVLHETVAKLHRLGTLGAELAAHDHLAALGTLLHDVAHNTVARAGEEERRMRAGSRKCQKMKRRMQVRSVLQRSLPAYGEASKKLVAQALALGDGAETLVGDALSKELVVGDARR